MHVISFCTNRHRITAHASTPLISVAHLRHLTARNKIDMTRIACEMRHNVRYLPVFMRDHVMWPINGEQNYGTATHTHIRTRTECIVGNESLQTRVDHMFVARLLRAQSSRYIIDLFCN